MAYRRNLPRRYSWPAASLLVAASALLRYLIDNHYGRKGTLETYVFTVLPVVAVVGFAALIQRRRALFVPPGHCPHCRYDLTGNESGKCPECGTPIPPETNVPVAPPAGPADQS